MTDADLKTAADALFISLGLVVSDHQGLIASGPTGERYEICTAIGVKLEGERQNPKSIPEAEQECIDGYLAALRSLAEGKSGTVYWRMHPEMQRQYGRFNIYSRLLISDKPALPQDAYEAMVA